MTLEKWTFIFTAAVAVSTVVYAILTWTLVRETSKMRKNQIEPYIIAYLDITETNARIAYLKTKNVGQGVALNVKFNIIRELNYPGARKLADYPYFRKGVKYFPPGHTYKHLLVSFETWDEESESDSVIFEVEYQTVLNEPRTNRYELNLLELVGRGNLIPPDTHLGNISYRLQRIEKLIEKYIEQKKIDR